MAKFRGAIVVDTEHHYAYMKNPEACIGCASCGLVCPDSVITVYKKNVE